MPTTDFRGVLDKTTTGEGTFWHSAGIEDRLPGYVGIPAKPTGLSATPGSTSASLSWNAITGADSIAVYYREGTEGEFTLATAAVAGDAITYLLTGLDPEILYNWRITATNAAGTSEPSDIDDFTTTDGITLNVPSVQAPAGTRDMLTKSGALDDLGTHAGESFGRWSFTAVDGAVSSSFTVVESGGFRHLYAIKDNGGGSPPYNLTFLYTLPADLEYGTELLTSYWIKHTISDSGATGQLKYIRWCRELHIYDKENECYMLHNTTSNNAQMYIRNSIDGLTDPQSVQYFDGDGMPTGLDKWCRVDVRFKMPTTNSSDDFECRVKTFDPDGIDLPNDRDIMAGTELEETPYKTADDKWRYIVFQNYVGNDTFDSTAHEIAMEGLCVTIGTLARVEIANNATYASATVAEILVDASWADGVITITEGPKHLTSGSRWLHVFNDAGEIVLTQEYV